MTASVAVGNSPLPIDCRRPTSAKDRSGGAEVAEVLGETVEDGPAGGVIGVGRGQKRMRGTRTRASAARETNPVTIQERVRRRAAAVMGVSWAGVAHAANSTWNRRWSSREVQNTGPRW